MNWWERSLLCFPERGLLCGLARVENEVERVGVHTVRRCTGGGGEFQSGERVRASGEGEAYAFSRSVLSRVGALHGVVGIYGRIVSLFAGRRARCIDGEISARTRV